MTAAIPRACLAILFLALAAEAQAMMRPRVVETKFPTDDIVIASIVVEAPAGDATQAIQRAIDEAAKAGGGVVFLPARRYRLEGRLVVKEGVTLRGDWQKPGGKDSHQGTTLAVVTDRGKPDAPATITLERGSGIREMVVWYPDQKPDAIVPYPWTIRTSQTATGNNITVHNVTLVNPYQAIKIGPEWNELHTIRNVYGTPLKTGIWIDTTTDIGRLIDVDFNWLWWPSSGLPGSPATDDAKKALREFLASESVAFEMRRSDWEYVYQARAVGYAIGAVIRPGEKGTANAVMYGCRLTGCGTALRLEGLNRIGLAVTGCRLYGDEYAVHAPASFDSTAQFHSALIAGRVLLDGPGTLTFQACTFLDRRDTDIVARRGQLSLLECRFDRWIMPVTLGEGVRRARILDSQPEGELRVENASRGDVIITRFGPDFARAAYRGHAAAPMPRPATRDLFAVTDFGAAPSEKDNTAAFARALDAARRAGGGTVYVPAGNYRFAGEMVVPSGVELRGSFDVPHHTVSGGSVLMPTAGLGNEKGTPFIRLEATSGLRGLTFWYPDQRIDDVKPYPWAIQALGPGCWLVDVTLGNAYQGADFWTHPSTGHVIRYLAGGLLRRGLFVSKCDGEGWVEDVQFNPHYAARVHKSLPNPGGDFRRLVDYQRAHLEALVFGRCKQEHVRGTFVYAAYDGIAFRDDGGGAAATVIEHGTDTGSRCAVLSGSAKVSFVNAQLVPLGAHEKGAIIVEDSFTGAVSFVNTQIWAGHTSGVIGGRGDVLLQQLNTLSGGFEVTGGRFTMEGARFARGLSPHVRIGAGCERARLVANCWAKGAFRIDNQAGERCVAVASSRGSPPPVKRATFRTGFEPGEPRGEADALARRGGGVRKVSRASCKPVETAAHGGKWALRVAGHADDPSYSFVYFRVFDTPIGVYDDTVLTYWLRPTGERGRAVGIDLLFTDGSTLRDSGARTDGGAGVHPGNPKGTVGKWTKVAIPLGSFHAGKAIAEILFAYDSRSGGGAFEAFVDDVAIERRKE